MNPVPGTVKAPLAPQVNLLPPEIAERRNQGRARGLILLSLVAFLLLLGGAWFYAITVRQGAEQDLADEQARRPVLMAELAEYDYLNVLADDYENSLLARAWAGSTDIDWSSQLAQILGAVPADIRLTDLQVTQGTPVSPAGTDGTVFGTPDMGVITFVGRSSKPGLVPDLQDALDALPGFTGAWVEAVALESEAESDTVFWQYTGSVRVTFQALSGRIESEQTEVPAELLEEITGGEN
jgi:Tfp pilus assembly protein PilN